MTLTPADTADLALAERFLAPAADLVADEIRDSACPFQVAVLLQCLAAAAVRFDPAAGDDFAALLAQAMREAAIDLMASNLTSNGPAS